MDPLLEFTQPSGRPQIAPIPSRWIRIPTGKEKCEWSGMRHAKFYAELRKAGKRIRTLSLKESGQSQGTRIVWLPDLMLYLHGMADAQAREEAEQAPKAA